jgi:hypothetical protein
LAISIDFEPYAIIPNPINTKVIAIDRRFEIGSPRMTRLKTAAKTGVDAKINTTFATLVLETAKTNAGVVEASSKM